MEHNENTKLQYVLICEQEAPGSVWQVSGPPGLLVAGSTLSAALSAVSGALLKMAMAEAEQLQEQAAILRRFSWGDSDER